MGCDTFRKKVLLPANKSIGKKLFVQALPKLMDVATKRISTQFIAYFRASPSLSITFNTSLEQKIGPVYAPNGPTLEFEVIGDRTNLIDLQNIFLEKNVGFSDLMMTNWNTMQVMLRQLVHHSLLILLYILFSRSAVLLRMASKFLLLIAITLKKLSLKEYFHTTRKQKNWVEMSEIFSWEETWWLYWNS